MIQSPAHACTRTVKLAVALLLAGCGKQTIELASPAGAPAIGEPAAMDWSDLSLTLSRITSGENVDYQRLLADHQALDRFLSLAAMVGPDSTPRLFPDTPHRLAYALNCYNATILRSVLELVDRHKLKRRVPPDIERRFRYRIDGRPRSPADLRRIAEALADGDWRVRLAMCDVTQTGPPLPRRVFLGAILDAQLNQVTRAAIASPRIVRIDHGEQKQLLVWQGLYDIKDRLIREHEVRFNTSDACLLNVLLTWSDRLHREILNTAIGYDVALMPRHDDLNALEPSAEENGGIFSAVGSVGSLSFRP